MRPKLRFAAINRRRMNSRGLRFAASYREHFFRRSEQSLSGVAHVNLPAACAAHDAHDPAALRTMLARPQDDGLHALIELVGDARMQHCNKCDPEYKPKLDDTEI
jgi:hypothetical protein